MIYQMMRDIEVALHALKYPVRFRYGTGRLEWSGRHFGWIRVERDPTLGDVVGPPIGVQANPKRVECRALGVVLTAYVKAPLDGAQLHEHEHVCDELVDALQIALAEWCVLAKTGAPPSYTETRYLTPEEYDDVEVGAGVIYRMRFAVNRGVAKRDYKGFARETVTLGETITTISET